MKTRFLVYAVIVLALIMLGACSKQEEQKNAAKNNGFKTLDDLRNSGSTNVDTDALREKAAKQSGSRINDKIKEAEKEKDKNDSKDKSNTGSSDKDKSEKQESIASSMLGNTGIYSGALNKQELSETLKLATNYVNKKYSKSIKAKDLRPADDNSKEYSKYPLYSIGSIIIYEFDNDGSTVYIAVGRSSSESEWKILNKK